MAPEHVSAHRATAVRRLLLGLVATVCRYPLAVLLVSLALCAGSLYAALTRLQYFTQRNDLMSPHKDYQQRWRNYLAEFGDDDDIVVVVKGSNRPQMEQALEALADRVRDRSDLFDRLFYKVDLRSLHNRALLFLSDQEIQGIQQNIKDMKMLLEFGPLSWSGLSLRGLLAEAQLRAEKLKPSERLSPSDEQFFTQLVAVSRSARATLADVEGYSNPWSSLMSRPPEQKDLLAEPQYFFSEGNKLAFLLVRPIKEQGSFTACLKSVNAMRGIVADARAGFPEVEFGLTGLPVLETDEMAAADHDTRLASYLAIAGVTLLFLLVYRSLYYPLLTVATLLIGTAWAMGWLTWTVGHLNILSMTFAVMLIGMGDYGVLWVMRYEQARWQGLSVSAALLHTTEHVAIGNLTAASTLALAFFAAMLADFQAVAELGWIAGCGVLLCAFACFTVLPALLMLCDRRKLHCGLRLAACSLTDTGAPTPADPSPSAIRNCPDTWLPGLARRPGWVLTGGLALIAVLAICAGKVQYDHNLLHLQAQDLESVRWEMTLIEHTAGASWHALSYTDTPGEALALRARYEQLPEVSRVVEVATLVPADQEKKIPRLEDIHHRLRHLPERGKAIGQWQRPSCAALRTDVAAVVQKLPAGGKLLADLKQSLQGLHEEMASQTDAALADGRLRYFDERLASDLAEDLHRLRAVATPAPITLDQLPADLRERYVGASGKWLLRVFAKDCLWDFAPLEHFTQQIRSIDPEATGKPFGTVEGLKAMKNGLERAGLYAFLVIAAVLLIDFRNWKHTAIALAPLVGGVILAVGVMGLCGVPLNPANMIAFPLILGVGVDNGVHILHDYLIRRREGRSGISHAIGRGVLVKALTTMIGFGTLMISTERGLAGLGLILTLGVGCSMLTALVLLPALLHWRQQRQEAALAATAVQPPTPRPAPARVAA
jgi:hopanoid biosynthesis associated RND transporter like protein HpnN